jgi:hypothetical protein
MGMISQRGKIRFLEFSRIIREKLINANDVMARLKQSLGKMGTEKTRDAGNY